ncbi:hypothetical protein HG66A1_36240 [Gimesia chilikensis]|uniref:Uncharacterized protein n=1 Tax=Gimesia chilikensis TaxID=2605989 RepID=A0A517PR31_9PLAN|nr:hypothetical protein HG66A1_36240 [Gimesia chilikensis]
MTDVFYSHPEHTLTQAHRNTTRNSSQTHALSPQKPIISTGILFPARLKTHEKPASFPSKSLSPAPSQLYMTFAMSIKEFRPVAITRKTEGNQLTFRLTRSVTAFAMYSNLNLRRDGLKKAPV